MVKVSLSLLAVSLSITVLVFALAFFPYDSIDPRQLESAIWTIIGLLVIPLIVLAVVKLFRSLLAW